MSKTATLQDAKNALATLVSAGLWPPYRTRKGEDAETTRDETARVWVLAAGRASVTGPMLTAAVDAYLDTHPDHWPAPAAVLALVPREAASRPPGCGRCSDVGMATVAVHTAAKVILVAAHCTCQRGQHSADRRTQPLRQGDPDRLRGLTVTQVADKALAMPGVVAVYIHPTEAERYIECIIPPVSPARDAQLRTFLAEFGRRQDPSPDDRWQDGDGRW